MPYQGPHGGDNNYSEFTFGNQQPFFRMPQPGGPASREYAQEDQRGWSVPTGGILPDLMLDNKRVSRLPGFEPRESLQQQPAQGQWNPLLRAMGLQ